MHQSHKPLPCAFLMLLPLLSLFSGAAHALAVSGTVVDAEEKPVPEALVWLVQQGEVQTTTTGPDGAFVFDKAIVAHTQLVAWREGFSLGGQTGPLFQDSQVMVKLRAPATIPLKLISNTFFPVASATIHALLINDSFTVPVELLSEAGFPRVRSNDEGLMEVPGIPANGYAKLSVTHPDFATSTVAYLPVRDERQELVLVPGVKVRGRVLHAKEGVADAHVIVTPSAEKSEDEVASAKTDPEGFFTLRMQEGRYRLRAYHAKLATGDPVVVEVKEDTSAQVELALETPRLLTGTILAGKKQPAPGVPVLFHVGETPYDQTLTDPAGQFSLRLGKAEGTLTLTPPQGWMTESLPDIPVDLKKAQKVSLKPIHLQPLPVVSGRITDDKGQPLGNVLLTTEDFVMPLRALSDAEGKFALQLSAMPEDKKVTLEAEHALRFLRKTFEVDLGKMKPLEVKLAQFSPNLSPDYDPAAKEKAKTVLKRVAPGMKAPEVPQADREMAALMNKPAPPLEASDWFNTEPLSMEKLKGKVVVLHFWAGFDDSIPGLRRLDELRSLHTLLADQEDLVFIGLHDASSPKEDVQSYVERFGLKYPVARDADPYKTFTSYGIVYIPQTLLIDKKGILRYYQTDGRLLELIKALRRE